MHKGNHCETCEIPPGVKYLIQCSVCPSNGKWSLFSAQSGRGGECQWPGSGTMWILSILRDNSFLMWRWRRLKVQVFVYELLVRSRLFGVINSDFEFTFYVSAMRLTGTGLLLGRRQCGPLPSPLVWAAQGSPGEPAERRLGWTIWILVIVWEENAPFPQ